MGSRRWCCLDQTHNTIYIYIYIWNRATTHKNQIKIKTNMHRSFIHMWDMPNAMDFKTVQPEANLGYNTKCTLRVGICTSLPMHRIKWCDIVYIAKNPRESRITTHHSKIAIWIDSKYDDMFFAYTINVEHFLYRLSAFLCIFCKVRQSLPTSTFFRAINPPSHASTLCKVI